MTMRRSGNPTAFWNAVAVGVNGTSSVARLSRESEQITIFISVDAATTVSIEVAHYGALTAEGNEPNASTPPAAGNFHQLYYTNTPMQIQFTAAGKAAIIVPDFEPGWVRLKSSAAANITAGFEVTGD